MSEPVVIRPMDMANVHQVAELEKICFADPWSLRSLQYEAINPGAVYLIAMRGESVLGYVGMHHVADEGHITNVAVAPAWRRKGIGRALILSLIAYARQQEMAFLTLEVRASNEAAAALYGGFGFAPAGLRKRYYKSPVEDAIIMTLNL